MTTSCAPSRNRGSVVTIEQVAKDPGVRHMTLRRWLRRAGVGEGTKPGRSRTELCEARKRIRTVASMGRVGSSGDNAAAESFFAPLQNNVLNRRTWTARERLRIAMPTSSGHTNADRAARAV